MVCPRLFRRRRKVAQELLGQPAHDHFRHLVNGTEAVAAPVRATTDGEHRLTFTRPAPRVARTAGSVAS